jgi:hypothetical protein
VCGRGDVEVALYHTNPNSMPKICFAYTFWNFLFLASTSITPRPPGLFLANLIF